MIHSLICDSVLRCCASVFSFASPHMMHIVGWLTLLASSSGRWCKQKKGLLRDDHFTFAKVGGMADRRTGIEAPGSGKLLSAVLVEVVKGRASQANTKKSSCSQTFSVVTRTSWSSLTTSPWLWWCEEEWTILFSSHDHSWLVAGPMVTCSMQTAGEISLMTMMMINLTDVINFQLSGNFFTRASWWQSTF